MVHRGKGRGEADGERKANIMDLSAKTRTKLVASEKACQGKLAKGNLNLPEFQHSKRFWKVPTEISVKKT